MAQQYNEKPSILVLKGEFLQRIMDNQQGELEVI